MSPVSKSPSPEQEEPTPSFLSKLDKLAHDAAGKLLGIKSKSDEEKEKLVQLTPEQLATLQAIESKAIARFKGDITQLEAALGMLRLGYHFGWKVLYIIHSKRTVRNYEAILEIKIREVFPDVGPSSYRSYGFNIADRFNNFWKVVGGEVKIPHKQIASK